MSLQILDLFSCIGCHALGMERAGHQTVALCEVNPWRRDRPARNRATIRTPIPAAGGPEKRPGKALFEGPIARIAAKT